MGRSSSRRFREVESIDLFRVQDDVLEDQNVERVDVVVPGDEEEAEYLVGLHHPPGE